MKPTLFYRIAAVLLVLFAAGHTAGFLTFRPPTAEALAVRDAMSHVQFQMNGTQFSYGGFYVGFGLFVSAYLLFAAVVAWHLGALASKQPRAIGMLGWALFGVQMASLVLCWIYFAAPQVIFSATVAACLGWAAYRVSSVDSEASQVGWDRPSHQLTASE